MPAPVDEYRSQAVHPGDVHLWPFVDIDIMHRPTTDRKTGFRPRELATATIHEIPSPRSKPTYFMMLRSAFAAAVDDAGF
jgi:hypothetical protein